MDFDGFASNFQLLVGIKANLYNFLPYSDEDVEYLKKEVISLVRSSVDKAMTLGGKLVPENYEEEP